MPGIFLCTDPVGRSVLGLDNEGAETGRSSKVFLAGRESIITSS